MTTKFQEQPAVPATPATAARQLSPAGGFISGGLAACFAVTVTNPLEVVKTRLQLQGELASKSQVKRVYTGVFQALGVIAKNEGIRGLQRGLLTAYSYQIALNGCRLGFYEPIRQTLNEIFYSDRQANTVAVNVFSGAASGIMGGLLGSPFFLVKTRMQSYSPVFAVGTQHDYKGNIDAFRKIVKQSGFRGLMKGADAAILRTGAGSSVQLPIYNASKRFIERHDLISEGPRKHLVASAASGVGVCCVMHVFDTILTRSYNQTGNQLYKNPLDCFIKIVRTEGFFALYKGFFAHLLRIGPHTVLTLTALEQTNLLVLRVERSLESKAK